MNALPSVEKSRNPASRPIVPPYYCVIQPLSFSEAACVLSLTVPVNVPHPEVVLVGAGVLETPQPPDIVSAVSVPLGLWLETPFRISHVTPTKLRVVDWLLLFVAVNVPRFRWQLGLVGPGETGVTVTGSIPLSSVTKKFVTVPPLRVFPETVAVTSVQEQLPGTEQVPV